MKRNNKIVLSGNVFNAEVMVISPVKVVHGREYLIRIGNEVSKITILKIKKLKKFLNKKEQIKNELKFNDIGEIEFSSNDIITFSTSKKVSGLNQFVLIDQLTKGEVCKGKINFAIRRSENIFKTSGKINKKIRSKIKGQTAKCVWLTGLSGSGKSTIAQALETKLVNSNKHTYILDGDNLRLGINKNLGFSPADRTENIRRIAELSKLMVDAGLIVIVAAISPFEQDRNFAKSLFEENEFFLIFVNTPLKVCMKRDPKKLYKKSKSIKNFNKIGLTGSYEKPKNPFLKVDTSKEKLSKSVDKIIKKIF